MQAIKTPLVACATLSFVAAHFFTVAAVGLEALSKLGPRPASACLSSDALVGTCIKLVPWGGFLMAFDDFAPRIPKGS